MKNVVLCALRSESTMLRILDHAESPVPGLVVETVSDESVRKQLAGLQADLGSEKLFWYTRFKDEFFDPGVLSGEKLFFSLALVENTKILQPGVSEAYNALGYRLKSLPDILRDLPHSRMRLPYLRALQALSGGYEMSVDAVLDSEP